MNSRHGGELRRRQPVDMLLKDRNMALVRSPQVKSDLRVKLIVTVTGYIRHLI